MMCVCCITSLVLRVGKAPKKTHVHARLNCQYCRVNVIISEPLIALDVSCKKKDPHGTLMQMAHTVFGKERDQASEGTNTLHGN